MIYENYYFKFFVKILLVPIFIFILIIRPLIHIIFISITTEKFGHFVEDTFLQHVYLEKKFKSNSLIKIKILYGDKIIVNKKLLEFWKQIYFFSNKKYLINLLLQVFKRFNKDKIFFIKSVHSLPHTIIMKDQVIPYKYPKDFLYSGEKILEQLNIPKNTDWICVASRTNQFDTDEINKNRPNEENYKSQYLKNNQNRNFNLDKIEPAIKKFLDNGYYVIDMSYKDKSVLNIDNKQFIKNYRTDCNEEIGDIFLLSNSKLYFGADSGVNNFHRILNIPQVTINTPDFNTYLLAWFFNKSLLVPKLAYSKSGEVLTIKQMERMNLFYKPSNFDVRFCDFELRSNSEDEVEKAAEEILFYIDKGFFKMDKEDKINLERLILLLKDMVPNSVYSTLSNEEFNFIISPYFLKKHNYILR